MLKIKKSNCQSTYNRRCSLVYPAHISCLEHKDLNLAVRAALQAKACWQLLLMTVILIVQSIYPDYVTKVDHAYAKSTSQRGQMLYICHSLLLSPFASRIRQRVKTQCMTNEAKSPVLLTKLYRHLKHAPQTLLGFLANMLCTAIMKFGLT